MRMRTRASVGKRVEYSKSAKAVEACRKFLILVQVVVLQMHDRPGWLLSFALVHSEKALQKYSKENLSRGAASIVSWFKNVVVRML